MPRASSPHDTSLCIDLCSIGKGRLKNKRQKDDHMTKPHLYLSRNYDDNLDLFKQELGEGESFDVIVREIEVAERRAALSVLTD